MNPWQGHACVQFSSPVSKWIQVQNGTDAEKANQNDQKDAGKTKELGFSNETRLKHLGLFS